MDVNNFDTIVVVVDGLHDVRMLFVLLREVVEVGVDMGFEEQQEISQRQYILH
jgi:hypothetical protein